MATQINYKQIKAEADLYKYQIVPSISSWNLTVTLKNYLWQDPSVTTPVKVQIWDTVRTITSEFRDFFSASNWFNSWSSELATKEIDYFVYVIYKSSDNTVRLWFSRIPYGRTIADFNWTFSNEKFITNYSLYTTTDIVVNIWRFSAILSASPYTWSTPSAWFQVINRPIYETKKLEINWAITWFSSVTNQTYYYWIEWCNVFIWGVNNIWWISNSTSFTMKLPFSFDWTRDNFSFIAVQDNGVNQSTPWHIRVIWNTIDIFKTFYGWSWTASWNKSFFLNSIMYPLI